MKQIFEMFSTIKFHEIANNVIQILPRRRREKQSLQLIEQFFLNISQISNSMYIRPEDLLVLDADCMK